MNMYLSSNDSDQDGASELINEYSSDGTHSRDTVDDIAPRRDVFRPLVKRPFWSTRWTHENVPDI